MRADFSEPESRRGPAEVKPAWAPSDRLKEVEKRNIMCPAIKKFLFFSLLKFSRIFITLANDCPGFLIGFFSLFLFLINLAVICPDQIFCSELNGVYGRRQSVAVVQLYSNNSLN